MCDSKVCFKCEKEKPLTEFYKHKGMFDGYLGKCKECAKTDTRENRKNNIDYYREYDATRYIVNPKRKEAIIAYSKTDAGKEVGNKAKNKWTQSNLLKRSASTIVGNAVRDGRLTKPDNCESCGSFHDRIHGHHDDYSFPMVVRWLCPKCHTSWHKENGEGLNG